MNGERGNQGKTDFWNGLAYINVDNSNIYNANSDYIMYNINIRNISWKVIILYIKEPDSLIGPLIYVDHFWLQELKNI